MAEQAPTIDTAILDDPAEFLKRQPKKSILKMKQDGSQDDGKEKAGAHFDEMNILATYHPADKDYGTMKIDEPKTPYHQSDCESEGEIESTGSAGHTRRVSIGGTVDLSEVTYGLVHPKAKGTSSGSEDDEELSEEQHAHKREFEKKRKAHYNEGALLKNHQVDDDGEDNDKDQVIAAE